MRLGVLDVGSNTVHFLVVDAYPGARPLPAFSHKVELRLAAHLEPDNTLSAVGEKRLTTVVSEAMRIAEDKGVEEVMAFATSAVREAVNGDDVLARVRERTAAEIRVLAGDHEARLTFLAARRWFGWSSGRLLVIDIGGGSLEIAAGPDEEPEAVMSLQLGAGRLTRDWLSTDPPPPEEVRAMRKYVRAEIARQAGGLLRGGAVDHAVGTSKTFRQLARIAGAAPSSEGFYVKRFLKHADVGLWAERLAAMDEDERSRLPGVSEGRAGQMLAGAIVADAVMDLMGCAQLQICPWALREGVILKRLDTLTLATEREQRNVSNRTPWQAPPYVRANLKATPQRTRAQRRRAPPGTSGAPVIGILPLWHEAQALGRLVRIGESRPAGIPHAAAVRQRVTAT